MQGIAKSDLTFLAKRWEEMCGQDYTTRRFALTALFVVCKVYLRGQGIKMENWTGLKQHGFAHSYLACQVVARVMGDPSKEIWFPVLHRIGFADYVSWISTVMEDGYAE